MDGVPLALWRPSPFGAFVGECDQTTSESKIKEKMGAMLDLGH
jgi:hypothetical protein